MCSTCNPEFFEKVELEDRGLVLQRDIGVGDPQLVIRCNTDERRFSIAVKSESKDRYRIYRCLTCGRFLPDF